MLLILLSCKYCNINQSCCCCTHVDAISAQISLDTWKAFKILAGNGGGKLEVIKIVHNAT